LLQALLVGRGCLFERAQLLREFGIARAALSGSSNGQDGRDGNGTDRMKNSALHNVCCRWVLPTEAAVINFIVNPFQFEMD
jgi:hypothetical protein